jgi:hypothetical protein
MKLSRYQSVVYALACSAGYLHADIVTLKDGKKLEGNITAETPTSIHMRYRLTPKVWDDKDILRSDIAEGGILKQKPEEVEMIELKKFDPTPDLMSAEKYEALIQDRLRPFLNRYPGTKEAAEVEKMITKVQEEKERVVAGGAKLEGKWLTREEAKAESLNIKAYGIRTTLQEKIAAKDYSGALREFDKLTDPRTGLPASVYYPKAVEAIIAVLTSYEGQLNQMIKDQPYLQKNREESTKKLIEPDLSRLNDAIKREMETWKSNYEEEHKVTRWFTPYKYELENLKTLAKTVSEEKERLSAVKLDVATKVNEAIAKLLRADAKAGKDKAELANMGAAIVEGETAAGAADPASKAFYRSIFTSYRERHAYFSQMVSAAPGQTQPAAAGAAGGSSAIAGTATPGVDDRVAAALAAASGAAPTAPATPAAVPAAGTPGMTAPAAVPGAVPPGTAPGAYPQQPGYAQPQAAAPAEPEAEGMSTMTMILIGIGVVGLVLLLTLLGGKKKKKE